MQAVSRPYPKVLGQRRALGGAALPPPKVLNSAAQARRTRSRPLVGHKVTCQAPPAGKGFEDNSNDNNHRPSGNSKRKGKRSNQFWRYKQSVDKGRGVEQKGAEVGSMVAKLGAAEARAASISSRMAELEEQLKKVEAERDESNQRLASIELLTKASTPVGYSARVQEAIAERAFYIGVETGSQDQVKNWYDAVMDFASGRVPFPKELLPKEGPATPRPPEVPDNIPDADTVLSIILGGGRGKRLQPLTYKRAKPAVPIGGTYRLIDVPLSNIIHSGIDKVYVMTQYNSRTLNRHLRMAFDLSRNPGSTGFLEVLSACQLPGSGSHGWFKGTADAVRKFTWMLDDQRHALVTDVLILSGDQLYRMNFAELVSAHRASNAHVTVACKTTTEEKAKAFGVVKVDNRGRITAFAEKLQPPALYDFKLTSDRGARCELERWQREGEDEKPYLASMGIYVFKKTALLELLDKEMPHADDFGSEVLPQALEAGKWHLHSYAFNGYWEDIGTIASFYEANLALTERVPEFDLYDAVATYQGRKPRPVITRAYSLPPTKLMGGMYEQSMIAKGCYLSEGCTTRRSIVGIRSHLEAGVTLEGVLMLGFDRYESWRERQEVQDSGGIPLGIGAGTVIKRAILDKNVRIGKNCKLTNENGVQQRHDNGLYSIENGIIVIRSGAVIPDGTVI